MRDRSKPRELQPAAAATAARTPWARRFAPTGRRRVGKGRWLHQWVHRSAVGTSACVHGQRCQVAACEGACAYSRRPRLAWDASASSHLRGSTAAALPAAAVADPTDWVRHERVDHSEKVRPASSASASASMAVALHAAVQSQEGRSDAASTSRAAVALREMARAGKLAIALAQRTSVRRSNRNPDGRRQRLRN